MASEAFPRPAETTTGFGDHPRRRHSQADARPGIETTPADATYANATPAEGEQPPLAASPPDATPLRHRFGKREA